MSNMNNEFDSSRANNSKEEVIKIDKNYLYDEIENLFNDYCNLRNKLDELIPTTSTSTSTLDRITNLFDRWNEFDVVPRNMSRVTRRRKWRPLNADYDLDYFSQAVNNDTEMTVAEFDPHHVNALLHQEEEREIVDKVKQCNNHYESERNVEY